MNRVAYVGWAGHGNMGDEGIFAAYRGAFPSCRLTQVSGAAPASRLRRAPWRAFRAVMLGGGTLVGWPGYRRTLASLIEPEARLPAFMLGTGVEDPSFYHLNPLLLEGLRDAYGLAEPPEAEEVLDGDGVFWRELAQWGDLLRHFRGVTVRGPRSRATLRRVGIEAEIVGDPALLLADETPAEQFDEKLLGINLGVARGVWGGDPEALLRTVIDFGRAMRDRGWRIVLVPVWAPDLPYLTRVARGIGGGIEVFRDFLQLERLLAAIRDCHVFVGQKLHSVVFSSAVYVPSVMLEYHPKCADFHDSLGRSRYTLRSDRVTSEEIVAAVDELATSRDGHQASLVAGVAHLRARLAEHAADVRRVLDQLGPAGILRRRSRTPRR